MAEPLLIASSAERWASHADVLDAVRVHEEPWEHLDDLEVHARLTAHPVAYLAHLRKRLLQLAWGTRALDLRTKRIFDDGRGDFRVMPCLTGSGTSAVKTVKIVGTNLEQRRVPDQITVGKAVRLDPVENFVTHVFDACLLSSARTGACATIALQLLMSAPQRVAIVGAGRVGVYTGIYLDATWPGIRIVYLDSQPGRAARTAAALTAGGADAVAGDREDLAQVDAVVLATSSRVPILTPLGTSARCVISVGADSPDQHELSADWIGEADIFIDSKDAREVGDVRAWLEREAFDHELPDLLALVRDPRPDRRRSVFISTGSALFDNLTIEYLLEA